MLIWKSKSTRMHISVCMSYLPHIHHPSFLPMLRFCSNSKTIMDLHCFGMNCSEKFIGMMKNTIQHYARQLFAIGDVKGGKKAYARLFKLDPTFTIAYNNFAVMLENVGDLQGAIRQFKAFEKLAATPAEKAQAAAALCRVALRISSTKGASLLSDSFSVRQQYFGYAKDICAIALQRNPNDPVNLFNECCTGRVQPTTQRLTTFSALSMLTQKT
eukprot:m.206089 g.206089  ORF g.206089 m.206089 type:complete len:215 (-) comp16901_c0_seq4:1874-2518(-)